MSSISDLLELLVKEWKEKSSNANYNDVTAEEWYPGKAQIDICPKNCKLEIYEYDTPPNWKRISGYDAYRQTRICREHGFAKIYVISGPTAVAYKWKPKV